MRMGSTGMTTMEPFEEFVLGSGNFGEWDPRIFFGRKVGPVNEVLVSLTEFATIEDSGDGWE